MRIIDLAADQATDNFLLVLDGLVTVESGPIKGKLELFYDNGEIKTRLNDESAEQLTVLFKEAVERGK